MSALFSISKSELTMFKTNSAFTRGALLAALALGPGLPPAAAEPSTFDITVLAGACANCHGTDGRSPGSIPSIAGRPESVLANQLRAFRSDAPPAGTTVMSRLTKSLTDQQIDALAAHFAGISRTPSQKAGKQ